MLATVAYTEHQDIEPEPGICTGFGYVVLNMCNNVAMLIQGIGCADACMVVYRLCCCVATKFEERNTPGQVRAGDLQRVELTT